MRARLRAWIGIAALLFYSALPLAHHARAAALPAISEPGAIVYELCTRDGLRVVQIPPADSGGKSDPSHRPYSCPICQALQHAQTALPPILWTATAPLLSTGVVVPMPVVAAPRPVVVAVPQSRAPPAIA